LQVRSEKKIPVFTGIKNLYIGLTNIRIVNLFDWTLKMRGFDIALAKANLKQLKSLSEDQFKDYVTQQKSEIVSYHLEHTSFYRELVGTKSYLNWEDLPVLTKRDLQQPLDNRLSNQYSSKNVYINKTSGSSGHPFVFAKDKVCHSLTWAVIQDRFGLYGIDFNASLQARFYGIPKETVGYYKERLKDQLSKRYRFSIFNLNDETLEKVVDKFAKTPFDYINGYTSSIVLLAKYLKSKNRILKNICPTLKVCVVTSEMLFESDRELLENYLGIPIINEYGASELDLIAFQYPDGTFRINSETLYVEILDENNKPVPKGAEGKIVITSLYNKAHPFIRYEIGDIGILDPESTPQKPILQKLVGRTNDIAKLPSGKIIPGLTFYYVTKSIIEDTSDIREFVVRQTAYDTFEIDYVGKEALSRKRKKEIENALDTYLEPGLHIIFNKFELIERQKSGKLKQFIGLPE